MLKPAIATVSLGRSSMGHDILRKIEAASNAGFLGIEIFFECLEDLARRKSGNFVTIARDTALREAAADVRICCDKHSIEVIVLQPFTFYDGLIDNDAHRMKLRELQLWCELCHILGTDLIQIPTNFQPDCTTGDINRIVADMTAAADMGLRQSPPIRFAYEGVSWGTHIDAWEGTWEVVRRVDRSNLGLCLDTFHITGRVWADPAAMSGQNIDADLALERSRARLVQQVDPSKIFYVQISDARRLDAPLDQKHPLFTPGQKPRMTWSRNARLFAYEYDRGAHLPIDKVMDAIFIGLQWQGWVSMEMFSQQHFDCRYQVPQEHARRGLLSWKTFCKHYPQA